jgi:hypothetical protein
VLPERGEHTDRCAVQAACKQGTVGAVYRSAEHVLLSPRRHPLQVTVELDKSDAFSRPAWTVVPCRSSLPCWCVRAVVVVYVSTNNDRTNMIEIGLEF